MHAQIERAIKFRKENKPDEAIAILQDLLNTHPADPLINYQMAWTYDFIGKEGDAVAFYERAINNGLAGDGRQGAMLGLGSTYRCLGKYQQALEILDRAINEFPLNRSFKVFRALTLYNLGDSTGAVGELLVQLLDTTSDDAIKKYEKALRFYADKLDETWA
jgi:tetratricopeptide (TPR) repeat protein